MTLLTVFEVIAKKIKPYQNIGYFLVLVFIALLVIPLLLPNQVQFNYLDINDEYGRLGLLACIWILLLNVIVRVFNDIPQKVINKKAIFKLLGYKIKRFFYFILALFFIMLTLVILILTIRLLRV